ncbi:MAG: glutathione-dependent formaldehyde dehydrogenase [Actinomycetota bacterium]|nr:glutathione-dependent formaldehyde dehydrogenase [Actinomycetota bacterium]
MKAVVFHGPGDIRVEEVPEPKLLEATDAIVRLTASAICGTDLHFIRDTMPGVSEGRILGHEGVGIVEEVGSQVRNLYPGDRVVIPSTIGCGSCAYCRGGYYAQCDVANPNGKRAGTAFFGGPDAAGGFDGLQAEYARIPYANVGPVKLPDEVSDEQAILLSDIFPTGYFGADLADIRPGHVVAVFGCGPVGQFAIMSALLLGAGRVLAVDQVGSRLDIARRHGAEVVDFSREDPVETILELTQGTGPDRVIDAVGVEAEAPEAEPEDERAPFQAGSAPTQAAEWAVQSIAKNGTIAVVGVYPNDVTSFPFGQAMMRNLTVAMGNCHHRRYLPMLVEHVRSGQVEPTSALTEIEALSHAVDAYEVFDRRRPGWLKVELEPTA